MTITGKDLLKFGFEGADLGAALSYVNSREWQADELETWLAANKPAPKLPLQSGVEYAFNLKAGNEAEADNVAKVRETMDAVMRTPTVRFGCNSTCYCKPKVRDVSNSSQYKKLTN